MRPRPSITLLLVAGAAALALSVRGWHSPETAVLGGALLLRAGFDLEPRSRFVQLRSPRRLVPLARAATPLPPKAQPGSRPGPGATGAPTRPRSAWTATGSPPGPSRPSQHLTRHRQRSPRDGP
jgi:hypothetical protein